MQVVSSAHTLEAQKDLFPLCDGTGLVYSFPWDTKAKGFFKTWDTALARNWHLENSIKESALKIHGWVYRQDSSIRAIFADFDDLPKGFRSWATFSKHLQKLLKGRAIIIPSFSGKTKALFLVEIPKGKEITSGIAIATLKEQLPSVLFNFCDLSVAAMSISFLTGDSLKLIHRSIKLLAPIAPTLVDYPSTNLSSKVIIHHYQSIEDLYSETKEIGEDLTSGQFNKQMIESLIFEHQLQTDKSVEEKFIKFALATPGLIKGFCISQEKLSKTLGISRKRAGRLLNKLVKADLIETTASYTIGYRPIKYRAKNRLLEALKCLYTERQPPISLPTSIKDDEWNGKIKFYGLRCFNHSPFKLIEWIKTIPGHEEGDRLKQAQRFAKWMLKTLRGQEIH